MDANDIFDYADLLALLVGSLGLAVVLAAWLRDRTLSPRRLLRRMMGAGALLGAAALVLID